MSNYIELHIHTTHTAGNSVLTINQAVHRAKKYGMTELGIMDSGTMSGVDTFVDECRKARISPVVGCGFYLTLKDHRKKADQKYHLPVIAHNNAGLIHLRELDRIAHTDGNIGRPQIDLALLKQCHEGLIVLTGGRGGAVDKLLKSGHHQRAEDLVLQLKLIVGSKNLFIELQDNSRLGDTEMNHLLADLGKKCQVECMVTGGPFYLDRVDAQACNKLRKANEKNLLDGDGFFFRSPEEQAGRFAKYPESLENSAKIAKRCSFL